MKCHRTRVCVDLTARLGLAKSMLVAQTAVQRVAQANVADEEASLSDSQGQRLVPYLQTAHSRVPTALRALRLTEADLFVDLGCGDGRVTLAAAADFGAMAVGVDISPALLRCCRRAANAAGFSCEQPDSRLRFLLADLSTLFEDGATAAADDEVGAILERATAIYIYLLPMVMLKLAPFLLRAVARGARVLTLDHHLPPACSNEFVAALPADCRPLARFLVPTETHLFGQMRLYCAGDPGPLVEPNSRATLPASRWECCWPRWPCLVPLL